MINTRYSVYPGTQTIDNLNSPMHPEPTTATYTHLEFLKSETLIYNKPWSPRFKSFGSSRNSLNPTFFDQTLTTSCVTGLTAARYSARLKELGPMKIKPTLIGFSGE